ncbi:MAG: hypothetical protein WD512_04900 [Candidatus Paceibacterota bacterium]
MPVFNIPLDRPRPIRGSFISEAARLRAQQKKAAAARRTPGFTASSQADIRNARARNLNRSLQERISRSTAINARSSVNTKENTQTKDDRLGTRLGARSGANLQKKEEKEVLFIIEGNKVLPKQIPAYKRDNGDATILPTGPINLVLTKEPTKVINEKFTTVVPSRNISKTLKVTGLTEAELNKALKEIALKLKK